MYLDCKRLGMGMKGNMSKWTQYDDDDDDDAVVQICCYKFVTFLTI
jgi:hypothetical protein